MDKHLWYNTDNDYTIYLQRIYNSSEISMTYINGWWIDMYACLVPAFVPYIMTANTDEVSVDDTHRDTNVMNESGCWRHALWYKH